MPRLKTLKPRVAALTSRIARSAGDNRTRDQQRVILEPWRRWYRTKRWRDLRMVVFARDLFTCQNPQCRRLEGNMALLVCDHIERHQGKEKLFWDVSNLQTLCKPCHDTIKQRMEKGRRF